MQSRRKKTISSGKSASTRHLPNDAKTAVIPTAVPVQNTEPMVEVAFFAAFYLCILFGVDTRLIYHGGAQIQPMPAFFWGWVFARPFFDHIGGIGNYASAFAMQSYYVSWLGALTATLQAIVMWLGARACCERLGLPRLLALSMPLTLLALFAKYVHCYETCMAMATALGALWIYIHFAAHKTKTVRLGCVCLILAVTFWVAPMSLVPLGTCLFLVEMAPGGSLIVSAGTVVAALAVALIEACAIYGYGAGEVSDLVIPVSADLQRLAFRGNGWLAWTLLCSMTPLIVMIGVLCGRLGFESTRLGQALGRVKMRVFAYRWVCASLCAATVAGVLLAAQDLHVKHIILADFYGAQNQWEKASQLLKGEPRDRFTACLAMRAAFHTGRLTQEIPQMGDPTDMLLAKAGPPGNWQKCDLYSDLGFANMVLHNSSESIETWGERPRLLKTMITSCMAVGNTATARIYLNAMTQMPFHSAWAKDYLKHLDADPSLAWDKEVVQMRRMMPKNDFLGDLPTDIQLTLLLKSEPQNRMAFEYLMTYYLMTKNLEQFSANLPKASEIPGFQISPLWNQAIVACSTVLGPSKIPPNITPDIETRRTFDQVCHILARYPNTQAARQELKASFGNTYFYYDLYGL